MKMLLSEKFNAFIETVCGDSSRINSDLNVIYGSESDKETEKYRLKLRKQYYFIISITAAAALISVVYAMAGESRISQIIRPEPGHESLYIPVEIEAEYDGVKVSRRAELTVKNRKRTEKEIEKAFDECDAELKSMFKDINSGIRQGNELVLPDIMGECGIHVKWRSSDPVLISEKGSTDVIALAGEEESVRLTAEMSYAGFRRIEEYTVVLKDDSEMYSEALDSRIKQELAAAAEESSESILKLPSESEDGVVFEWKTKKRDIAPVVILFGICAFLYVYSGRYSYAVKYVKKYRASVLNEFPSVIDKLILLLNSGLTVFNALMRISQDFEKRRIHEKSAYGIGREAAEIGIRVRNTNSDVIEEWKNFASRMESGEMLRFCTILEDNMNRGSSLAEKLEGERDNLRESRRKEMQKKIQLVDSKMMVPMMIMLFSLILVTVAPAILSF